MLTQLRLQTKFRYMRGKGVGGGLNPLPILDQLHLEEGDQGVDEHLKAEVKAFDPTSEC